MLYRNSEHHNHIAAPNPNSYQGAVSIDWIDINSRNKNEVIYASRNQNGKFLLYSTHTKIVDMRASLGTSYAWNNTTAHYSGIDCMKLHELEQKFAELMNEYPEIKGIDMSLQGVNRQIGLSIVCRQARGHQMEISNAKGTTFRRLLAKRRRIMSQCIPGHLD